MAEYVHSKRRDDAMGARGRAGCEALVGVDDARVSVARDDANAFVAM